jgi:hypothetical protein
MFKDTSEANSLNIDRAMTALAESLGQIHRQTHPTRDERQKETYKLSALSNLRYESGRLFDRDGKKFKTVEFDQLAWLKNDSFVQRIKESALAFKNLVEEKDSLDKIYCSSIHGDAHLGNFFFDATPESKGIAIIDPETMTWSIKGNSSSAEDLGRVLGSLYINVYKSTEKEPYQRAKKLEELFLKHYFKALNLDLDKTYNKEDFMVAINYFKNKFLMMNMKYTYVNTQKDEYGIYMEELAKDIEKNEPTTGQ